MDSLRDLLLGSERHIGLWIVPLFLITALLGAVLAGGLAVLYYAQQVADLEAETAGARAQLEQAVAAVTSAADQARTSIDERARQVEERFADVAPIESPTEAGIYGIAARHEGGEVRTGSGFTVYSDGSQAWVVTNYRVVATPDGYAVNSAEVFVPGASATARVHNYDRDLDLAVLVLSRGSLPVLPWRPLDQPLQRGDPIWLAGVAGRDAGTVIEGSIATANNDTIVPNVPVNTFLAGGPLLDAAGQVAGIASLDYSPFGPARGNLGYSLPIRVLCRALLRCTAADLGLGESGGRGALPPPPPSPAPGPVASSPPPPPPPAPPPPPPSPEPTFSSPEPTFVPAPAPFPTPTPTPSPT